MDTPYRERENEMPGKEKLRRIAEPIDARGVILGKKYTDSITKIKGTASACVPLPHGM